MEDAGGPLRASICSLPLESQQGGPLDAWRRIVELLVGAKDSVYRIHPAHRFRLLRSDMVAVAPDRSISRVRCLEARPFQLDTGQLALELGAANAFFHGDFEKGDLIRGSPYLENAGIGKWIRSVAAMPLVETTRIVDDTMGNALDAGVHLAETTFDRIPRCVLRIENGVGSKNCEAAIAKQLARRPLSVVVNLRVGVTPVGISGNAISLGMLAEAAQSVVGARDWTFKIAPWKSSADVTLVVFAPGFELEQSVELRHKLYEMEQEGRCFKLVRLETLGTWAAVQSVVFDMFQIAGGVPWVVHDAPAHTVGFDAGHSADQGRSRWVACSMTAGDLSKKIEFRETNLAEHIPIDVLEALGKGIVDGADAIFRDGRLASEQELMKRLAIDRHTTVIEVKKNPIAVLFRGNLVNPKPAMFGDGLQIGHNEALVQTFSANARDYGSPVGVRSQQTELTSAVAGVVRLASLPTPGLYFGSRLGGGPIYWADLVSKMTAEGWTRAIGRGFKLDAIIPR